MTDPSAQRLAHPGAPSMDAQVRALGRAKAALLGGSRIPESVGRYQIRELIGAGGMGEIYRAHDPDLQRDVAVKLIAPRAEPGAQAAQDRLIKEARAVAALSHPNVVAVHDVGVIAEEGADPGSRRVYLVMELIDGIDLRRWLRAERRSTRDIIDVFLGAGAGLLAAHRADLVHRDFKPSNVLIDGTGRARVVDFGLVATPTNATEGARQRPDPDSTDTGTLTESGVVLGTPAYMAPEQHAGHVCDQLTDQYSFCLTLAEAALGRFPFSLRSSRPLAQAKREESVELVGPRRAPRALKRLLRRGLRANPGSRYPDLEALLGQLRRIRGRTRRLVLGVGAAGGLVLAGALAWSNAESSCDQSGRRIEAVWNEEVQLQLASNFGDVDAPFAQDAWRRVRTGLDAAASGWTAAHSQHCRADADGTAAVAVRARQAACLERELAAVAEAVGALQQALDAVTVQRAPQLVHGLPGAERCLGPDGPPHRGSAAPPDAGYRAVLRARALSTLGDLEGARELAAAAVQAGRDSGRADLEARAELRLARIAALGKRGAAAARHAYRAAFIAERSGANDLAFEAHMLLMRVLTLQTRLDEAREAGARCDRLLGEDIPGALVARYRLNLALLVLADDGPAAALNPLDDAEQALRSESGPASVALAELFNTRGAALRRLGRLDEAGASFERALRTLEASVGPQHPNGIAYRSNLGDLLCRMERPAEALPHFERVLDLARWSHGAESLVVADGRRDLGWALGLLGYWSRAQVELEAALAIQERLAPESVGAADTLILLANLAMDGPQPQPRKAVDRLRRAHRIAVAARGPEHPDTIKVERELTKARELAGAD